MLRVSCIMRKPEPGLSAGKGLLNGKSFLTILFGSMDLVSLLSNTTVTPAHPRVQLDAVKPSYGKP